VPKIKNAKNSMEHIEYFQQKHKLSLANAQKQLGLTKLTAPQKNELVLFSSAWGDIEQLEERVIPKHKHYLGVIEMIISMKTKIESLEKEVSTLRTMIEFAPGGSGYEEAEAEFNGLRNAGSIPKPV
jgi:hypothetical protein